MIGSSKEAANLNYQLCVVSLRQIHLRNMYGRCVCVTNLLLALFFQKRPILFEGHFSDFDFKPSFLQRKRLRELGDIHARNLSFLSFQLICFTLSLTQ